VTDEELIARVRAFLKTRESVEVPAATYWAVANARLADLDTLARRLTSLTEENERQAAVIKAARNLHPESTTYSNGGRGPTTSVRLHIVRYDRLREALGALDALSPIDPPLAQGEET
jgi:hypothetical protein